MWSEAKQTHFNALRAAERQGTLTAAERTELAALTQELDTLEAAYLTPATARVQQEREALEAQNRQLEELLHEQQTYLAEVRSLVAELQRREQRWRARYAAIIGRAWAAEETEASG
jgi:hypothetical protein